MGIAHAHINDGSEVVNICLSQVRYSLAGSDTRPSPERPGFESRWRKICVIGVSVVLFVGLSTIATLMSGSVSGIGLNLLSGKVECNA